MGLQLGKLGGIYGRYNAYPQILQFTGAMNQFPLRLNPHKNPWNPREVQRGGGAAGIGRAHEGGELPT